MINDQARNVAGAGREIEDVQCLARSNPITQKSGNQTVASEEPIQPPDVSQVRLQFSRDRLRKIH